MENELVKVEARQVVNIEDQAMSCDMLVRQIKLIQEMMKTVMKDGEHYGIIPGCGKKPSLLKPGAEKLGATFRFAPSYKVTRSELQHGHREYEIFCSLEHIPTGKTVGQGLGSCSTMESKYRYRSAEKACPECGAATIIKGKVEYGGGWICFAKKGGCGAKFKDGDQAIEGQATGRVEHDNPADYWNTCMKMAKKRAHVDAILTATSASDIFTQDVEDLPQVNTTPPPATDTPKADPKPNGKSLGELYQELSNKASTIEEWEKIEPYLKRHKADLMLIEQYHHDFELWQDFHAPTD